MNTTPQELRDRAAIQNGEMPKTKDGVKTEPVIKFFQDADKIAAIKAADTRVTVGTPPMQITIRPMSPLGIATSYQLIRKLLLPIVAVVQAQQEGRQLSLSVILEAFGDNVELLPELIFNIIKRGNPDITREWCDEHLDFLLDIQVILPLFLTQNGLDKLFAKKDVAAKQPLPPPVPLMTEELPAASTSSADITPGQPTTPGTE